MVDKEAFMKEYRKVKTVLLLNFPFVASLLNKARVVASTKIETACVNNADVLVINPEFFMGLSFEDRVFTVAHEVFHWAFRDPERGENKKAVVVTGNGRTYSLWNLVADGVNNDILRECLKPGGFWREAMVTKNTIWEQIADEVTIEWKDFEKMSKEQIYRLVESILPKFKGFQGGAPEDLTGEDVVPDFVVQEGDEEYYKTRDEKVKEELMKNFISEAYAQQKQAGDAPGGLKRIVDRILKSKINWREKLRKAMKEGFGKTVVSTYTRLSRKLGPQAPGYKHLTMPEVHIGIDTSGSISKKELEQFLGEVFAVAKNTKVYVTCWDAEAYETIEVKSPSQVVSVVKNKLRGGYGTCIGPYLNRLIRAIKPMDIVIILTDGEIFDISREEVVQNLRKITCKASKTILVTTSAEPQLPRGWEVIKLEL